MTDLPLRAPASYEMLSGDSAGFTNAIKPAWKYKTLYSLDLDSGIVHLQEGYDVTIGTSERGSIAQACQVELPAFQHLLIVFGGPLGLEDLFSKDKTVASKDPRESFSMYMNTCPEQGSRTIRTEEAILISLTYLQPALYKDRTNK